MNNTFQYPSGSGPWGVSPTVFSDWIKGGIDLYDIFFHCLQGDTKSIGALNSLCITLQLSHRFYPETIDDDLKYFAKYLENEWYVSDFSSRVSHILTERLPEKEGAIVRDFLEKILYNRKTPTMIFEDAKKGRRGLATPLNEIEKDVAHAILSMLASLGSVGVIYQILLLFRILGLG